MSNNLSDKFENMFFMQEEFTQKFFREKHKIDINTLSDEDKLSWNKEYVMSIVKEASDLLTDIDWRGMNSALTDRSGFANDNFLEDSIDVLKYTLGLLILNGYTKEQIYQKFVDKSNVVNAKFDQNSKIDSLLETPGALVALVDIDGVISNYPSVFIEWFNNETNSEYITLYKIKSDNIKLYHAMKHRYRTEGLKRKLGRRVGAREFLIKLKENNVSIILLTSRPYKKYGRIYSDTLYWLKINRIPYDAILWSENKAKYAMNKLSKCNIVCCIDDQLEQVNSFGEHGYNTFYVGNRKLDGGTLLPSNKNVHIIKDSLMEVFENEKVIDTLHL